MKILDRFIVSTYLRHLAFSWVAAIVIFLVVNSVENLDKFIDKQVPASTILQYYLLFIPHIIYLILPAVTLLATLFTIGGFTASNELTAIKIAGVPFSRLLFILLVTATVCAGGVYILGETVIPGTNRQQIDIWRYEVKKIPRENRAVRGRIYLQVGENNQMYIENYRSASREALGIKMLNVVNGKVKGRIDAEKMIWRDNAWHVQGTVRRIFGENGQVAWSTDADFTLKEDVPSPDQFEKVQTKPEEMNSFELREFIHRLKQVGGLTRRWDVELLAKISTPAAAVIIVFFGAPIAAVRRRGGTVMGFGISLFVCFIYFGLIQVGKVLGFNGTIPPWSAAWGGNIVFGTLGMWMLFRSKD